MGTSSVKGWRGTTLSKGGKVNSWNNHTRVPQYPFHRGFNMVVSCRLCSCFSCNKRKQLKQAWFWKRNYAWIWPWLVVGLRELYEFTLFLGSVFLWVILSSDGLSPRHGLLGLQSYCLVKKVSQISAQIPELALIGSTRRTWLDLNYEGWPLMDYGLLGPGRGKVLQIWPIWTENEGPMSPLY